MNSEEARKLAETTLSKERFYHTECVARAAEALAKRHGADPEAAKLAGYLHDIAKERDKDDLLQMIEGSDIIDFDEIRQCPQVWHAYAGGVWAREELSVSDDIAGAIAHHTTAAASMTKLEMIVFIADFISEDRGYDETYDMRELAFESLESAVLGIVERQVRHIMNSRRYMDINIIRAYNDLIGRLRDTGDI